ncbi:MAG: hypothetical protein R3B45_15700 [Bdellovibrionota bacterium]
MRFLSILILSLMIANIAIANEEKIGIKEFTETIVSLDPETKNILNELNRSAYVVDLNLPSDHFVFGNNSKYSKEINSSASDYSIATTITKPFNNLGSKVEVSHLISNNFENDEQTTSIAYEQSIIKNAFGEDYRIAKESAQLSVDVLESEVLERFEARVEAIINLYFDYQLALIAVGNSRKLLDDAEKLLLLVSRKVKDAIASNIDEARANHEVLVKRAELDQYRSDLHRFETLIKSMSGRIITPKSLVNSKNNVSLGKLIAGKRDFEDVRLIGLASKEKVAQRKISLVDHATRPDLGVMVGALKDSSTQFGLESNRNEIFIGLKLSMALGEDSQLSAQHKQAIFEKSKIDLDRHQYLSERERNIEELVSLASYQLKLIEVGEKTLENAAVPAEKFKIIISIS